MAHSPVKLILSIVVCFMFITTDARSESDTFSLAGSEMVFSSSSDENPYHVFKTTEKDASENLPRHPQEFFQAARKRYVEKYGDDSQAALTMLFGSEMFLEITYEVHCSIVDQLHGEIDVASLEDVSGTIIPAMFGKAVVESVASPTGGNNTTTHIKTIRFDLFHGGERAKLVIGQPIPGQSLRVSTYLFENPNCELLAYEHKIVTDDFDRFIADNTNGPEGLIGTTLEVTARLFSPFVRIRKDQVSDRSTDILMGRVITPHLDDPKKTWIQYTDYFSDEDSKTSKRDGRIVPGLQSQLSRYGRRTDIEWVSRVFFGESEGIDGLTYQGRGDVFTWTHESKKFEGTYLPGGTHPILQNAHDNNLFKDNLTWKGDLEGYHYDVSETTFVPEPGARERYMLQNPWMFLVSDFELFSENKLEWWSDEFLMVFVRGDLHSNGKFTGKVTLEDGTVITSGDGGKWITKKEFGQDMWEKESVTAIPVGRDVLDIVADDEKGHTFEFDSKKSIVLEGITFYRLVFEDSHYRVEDLTPFFDCGVLNGFKTSCTF